MVGLTMVEASYSMSEAGLCLRSIEVDSATASPPGTVLAVKPQSGTIVLSHSDVRITMAAPLLFRYRVRDYYYSSEAVSSFAALAKGPADGNARMQVALAPTPLVKSQPACTIGDL